VLYKTSFEPSLAPGSERKLVLDQDVEQRVDYVLALRIGDLLDGLAGQLRVGGLLVRHQRSAVRP
jgi:hypothetical protein